jgi:hypothetical protein
LRRHLFLFAIIAVAPACGGSDAVPASVGTVASTPTISPVATATVDATPAPTFGPTPTHTAVDPTQPFGFPLDPSTATDRVVGAAGARVLVPRGGRSVRQTSVTMQVADDPPLVNEDGWNCRVHVEYEGQPAVDWYVQPGQPVHATMDGTACSS